VSALQLNFPSRLFVSVTLAWRLVSLVHIYLVALDCSALLLDVHRIAVATSTPDDTQTSGKEYALACPLDPKELKSLLFDHTNESCKNDCMTAYLAW
jgi:hypothetical protein